MAHMQSGCVAPCGCSQVAGLRPGLVSRTQIARLQARPCVGARSGGRTAVAPLAAIKEIFMPALSSTMTEGKVVTWLKSPGDKITKGESVVVVESDKADMDVESFTEGFLGGIVIQEGGVANVGEALPAFDCPDRFDALQVMRSRMRLCAMRSAHIVGGTRP